MIVIAYLFKNTHFHATINIRAHDANFDVTHGKLVGEGHVITVSGTVIFSNVEKLLDNFIILAERSLHNSVMIIDLTHCHYLDQISAKVLSNGFQYPSIKTVFIVCCKGTTLHSLLFFAHFAHSNHGA